MHKFSRTFTQQCQIIILFQESVLEKLKDKIADVYNSNDSDSARNNLLQIEVFYEDFNYEQIEEFEAYKVCF